MKAQATIEDLQAAKSGDAGAVQKVWAALRPLAFRCSNRYAESVRRDLMQEAYLAVLGAIKATKFRRDGDPEREWGRFTRYAEQWIAGRMFRVAVVSKEWVDRSLDSPEGENVEGNAFVVGEFPVHHHGLMFAFSHLTDEEKLLLHQRFIERMTLREIAAAHGWSANCNHYALDAINAVLTKMRGDILFARSWGER